MTTQKKSVAVITSTIGRPELKRAIESVKNQTYPCKHYIFVDGAQFAESAKAIIEQYDNLVVTYLPMNTGANGWVDSSINAIAPYLIKEDILCYVDDDNWYEPNHIQSIIETFEKYPDADFVYALRNFIDLNGKFICNDNFESLGIWDNKVLELYPFNLKVENNIYHLQLNPFPQYHIDTNCYAFKNHIAVQLAPTWFSGIYNDKSVLKKIIDLQLRCACTKQYSVNYIVDVYKMFCIEPALIELNISDKQYEQSIRKQLSNLLVILGNENIHRHNGRPWVE